MSIRDRFYRVKRHVTREIEELYQSHKKDKADLNPPDETFLDSYDDNIKDDEAIQLVEEYDRKAEILEKQKNEEANKKMSK